MENNGILLPYRLSTFKEKALKLSVLGLTFKQTFLGRPPTSAEKSGYKRTLNIFSMLSPLVGILQQKG